MRVGRVAVVGPSSAFPGGIAQHTAELVSRLDKAGLLVEHVSWGRQFPRGARPGTRHAVVAGRRSVRETGGAPLSHDLHWDRPGSWLRVGRRLRGVADRLVIVVSSPLQLPAILVLAASFRGTAQCSSSSRDILLIVHNVLPHDRIQFDQLLMRQVLRIADQTIVHSAAEARLAEELGARGVMHIRLPLHPPNGLRVGSHPAGNRRLNTLGFLGFVRPYKGLDILLEALAQMKSQPRLIIQGEFWEPIQRYRQLITSLALSERVDLRPSYASGPEISDVLGRVDALILPYRSVTGSQQSQLAFLRGVPVIASAVGDLASQIRHGRDGQLITDLTASKLALAVDEFYSSGFWLSLRHSVQRPDIDGGWDPYLHAVSTR